MDIESILGIPDKEKLFENKDGWEKNREWFEDNYENLEEKYGDEIVAILGEEVLCHSEEPKEIRDELSELLRKEHLRTYVQYIKPKDQIEIYLNN